MRFLIGLSQNIRFALRAEWLVPVHRSAPIAEARRIGMSCMPAGLPAYKRGSAVEWYAGPQHDQRAGRSNRGEVRYAAASDMAEADLERATSWSPLHGPRVDAEGPLVGGARSAGRTGVRDGLQARRGRGGAPAGRLTKGRAKQPWRSQPRLLRVCLLRASLAMPGWRPRLDRGPTRLRGTDGAEGG